MTQQLPGETSEKRQQVFLELFEEGDPLTPSQIGDRLGFSRELVHHHLKKLVGMGLITRSDGEYRCQPVFTDPVFQEEFVGLIADLMPEVAERVVFNEDADAEAAQATVFNCLKMTIAINMMPPDEY